MNPIKRLAQFYRCTRYIPPRQLLRRAYLSAKRQTLCRFPITPSLRVADDVSFASELPLRPYSPRTHFARRIDGSWYATQLHCAISLQTPINWMHPEVYRILSEPASITDKTPEKATHLERLTFHYHEFIEGLPPEDVRAVISDWIDHNPPCQRGYWLDNWNSYAISIRVVIWLQWIAQVLRAGHSLPNGFWPKVMDSVIQQVEFLVRNLETDICGNHLVKNIRCLLWSSACFTGQRAERWRHLGLRLLNHEIERQILPDGMHYELSPAYHCQVIGDLLDCAVALPVQNQKSILIRIKRSIDAMQLLTHPDGLISLFSDGGLNMVYLPAQYREVWRHLCDSIAEAGERSMSLNLGSEALGSVSATSRNVLQANQSSTDGFKKQQLHSAGYYQWDNEYQWLLVDCGPICADSLPAHGHADALSFEWDVAGHRIVVDRGVFKYEAGDSRTSDRSAQNHNTVCADGQDQCELIGSFRTGWRTTPVLESLSVDRQSFRLAGSHNAFHHHGAKLTHFRTFVATEKYLKIVDQLQPPTDKVAFTANFLLHDECKLNIISKNEVHILVCDVLISFKANQPISVEATHWSPDFGQKIPTNRLVVRLPDNATAEYIFTIL